MDSTELTPAQQNRENQAARIRWLLERADHLTCLEFIAYATDHPFVNEED